MSRCFGSSSNLSAKEYTYKKRDVNMFCDLKQGSNTEACIDSGIVSHFNNNTVMLQIKKGYGHYLKKNTDLSSCDLDYPGQQIKSLINYDNSDISNNYTGMLLTVPDTAAQTGVLDSSGQYINKYAEIKKTDTTGNKKTITQRYGIDLPIKGSRIIIT
jgi:hypothetical protein